MNLKQFLRARFTRHSSAPGDTAVSRDASVSRNAEAKRRFNERVIACGLCVAYVLLLLLTTKDLGYARDEGFYFEAASSYGKWFNLLFSDPGQAFSRAAVDRYWAVNHEHPALIKSLFWFSKKYLHGLPLLGLEGTAYRFPGMVLSGLAVSVIYLWGSAIAGRLAGWVAALSFAFLPRIFYHAHLACFDMPVLAMWLITTYAYWQSTRRTSWRWAVATAILYGLLLNTKHNSWLLPGALFFHLLLDRALGLKAVFLTRFKLPQSWPWALLLSPLVFFATWPWIWFNTFARLKEYADFHMGHVYYNMEFLGHTYFRPPMPRAYAWVMTLSTVPAITLLLFGAGVVLLFRTGVWHAFRWRLVNSAFTTDTTSDGGVDEPTKTSLRYSLERGNSVSTQLLWLLCILLSYAPWWTSKAPIFGGTKHWITAYPFMCLFAGVALAKLCDALSKPVSARIGNAYRAVAAALVVAVPMVIGLHAHPWGLSAYTPLVGGAPGAATLGLNRSFWGYTTASVADYINQHAPKNAKVFVHDTAMQSFSMMEKDGMLRRDLRPWGSVHGSDLAIYHHEQHMSRVEFMIWVDYGTTTPATIGAFDGVPVVWVYQRPKGEGSGD